MNREKVIHLRPEISNILDHRDSREMEQYQSDVLRPIAKFQNEIILRGFDAYLRKYHLKLEGKSIKDQEEIISKAMKTNKELRCFYQGMLTGLMTTAEFEFYVSRRAEVHKRMTSLLIQRITSQIILKVD